MADKRETGNDAPWGPVVQDICVHSECADKGTYKVPARCLNCDYDYTLEITKGHETPTPGATCPNCGCRRVKKI